LQLSAVMSEPLRPYTPWGMLAAIDLHGCGFDPLADPETSSITVHADEVAGRCFIDVFSCRAFDAEHAAAVAVEHFGGTPTLRVRQR
jgi:S-adenosylmethionine/arginine decarboxylase-like enzyme